MNTLSQKELDDAWQEYRCDEEPTRPPNEDAPTREETFKAGYKRGLAARNHELRLLRHAVQETIKHLPACLRAMLALGMSNRYWLREADELDKNYGPALRKAYEFGKNKQP